MYAHEWIRDFPHEAWKSRYTYTLWGLPQAGYPKLLAEYFAFCRSYYKQHGYRCNVVNGASRLHQDRSSLFSVSFQGPMITLEPSSTGDRGWDEFLIDFNDFASVARRHSDVQSVARVEARACDQGIRRARQAVPRAAATHRPAQPALQQLLLAPARRLSPGRLRPCPAGAPRETRDIYRSLVTAGEQIGRVGIAKFGGCVDGGADRLAVDGQLGR